jgi:micrococcal nuclease
MQNEPLDKIESKLVRQSWTEFQRGRWTQLLFVLPIILALVWLDGGFNQMEITGKASVTETSNTTVSNPIIDSQIKNEDGKPDFTAKVIKVIDGDTIDYEKDGVKKRVRLMGIDTPETKDPRKPVQCFGLTAAAKTKELLEGKTASFQKDSKESLDKYGRELLYVYAPDGMMVNRYLVAEGYAFATPQYHFDRREEFVNLEKESRISSKGLWNDTVCKYKNQYGTN